MSDHDALLNAILERPDDDVPRLVYADFVQDRGEDERAAFIRDQIELARTPDWEPFAVRWHRRELAERAGDRWRSHLPWHDSWNPRFPFRRGLGYAVKTPAVRHLLEHGDELFASAPIGELHLPGGDMQEYAEFARQPWLPRVQSVRFWTLTTPTEPVRALAASPGSTGLRAIHFEKASSPGMSFLVEGIFQSPLGRQLRELSFRVGDGSQLDLVEALESGGETYLERLAFVNMGLDQPAVDRLADSPVLATVTSLAFADMFFNDRLVERLLAGRLRKLESLEIRNVTFRPGDHDSLQLLANRVRFPKLRSLDFTDSGGFRDQLPRLVGKASVGLRRLRLAGVNSGEGLVREIAFSKFWPFLVELDLSRNQLEDGHARALLAANPPKELVTLDLRGNDTLSAKSVKELRRHYGEAVLLDS